MREKVFSNHLFALDLPPAGRPKPCPMSELYTIGEFSKITGLSTKTLRFYHEKELIVPSSVDSETGYRYYDASKIEIARVVMRLRAMEFSLEDIAAILEGCDDEAEILHWLERRKHELMARIRDDKDIVRSLDEIIVREREAGALLDQPSFAIECKQLLPIHVGVLPMTGKYSDCGKGFARLAKTMGRNIGGKPLCLYHDGEYREEDARFDVCFPLRKEITASRFECRSLPGGMFLSLIHKGPYQALGLSYERLLQHVRAHQHTMLLPTREVYLKGPGMIFRGNPKNYLTEILLPIED